MHIKLESLRLIIKDEIDKYLSEIDTEDVNRFASKLKKQVQASAKVKGKLDPNIGKRDDRKGCFTADQWLRFQNNINKSEKGKLFKKVNETV
jgi:hypothetical protein